MPPKAATKGSKRKASALARNAFDAKLQRVARALENLTRAGAAAASGTSQRFPPPALVLQGDSDGELHFPVGKHDAQRLKARAATTSGYVDPAGACWEIDAAALKQKNARWTAFVKESFETMRAPLGIAAAAKVDISLRKLVVLEAGGRLHVRRAHEKARGDSVFGALLVALPGAFKGADVVADNATDAARGGDKENNALWQPAARKSAYDLAFAALYDHSTACVAEPVASGAAAFLVYDLATSTPSEVPVFGGAALLQNNVQAALAELLSEPPTMAPAVKRKREGADDYQRVDDVFGPRHFVYLVSGNTFETLRGNDKKVAELLSSFCAQSQGAYVLYLAGVLLSRESANHKGAGYREVLEKTDGLLKAAIKKPWLKHGTRSAAPAYPPIYVDPMRDIAPLAAVEDVELCVDVYDMDMADYDIVEKRHWNFRRTGTATTYALVVQPAATEARQKQAPPKK